MGTLGCADTPRRWSSPQSRPKEQHRAKSMGSGTASGHEPMMAVSAGSARITRCSLGATMPVRAADTPGELSQWRRHPRGRSRGRNVAAHTRPSTPRTADPTASALGACQERKHDEEEGSSEEVVGGDRLVYTAQSIRLGHCALEGIVGGRHVVTRLQAITPGQGGGPSQVFDDGETADPSDNGPQSETVGGYVERGKDGHPEGSIRHSPARIPPVNPPRMEKFPKSGLSADHPAPSMRAAGAVRWRAPRRAPTSA